MDTSILMTKFCRSRLIERWSIDNCYSRDVLLIRVYAWAGRFNIRQANAYGSKENEVSTSVMPIIEGDIGDGAFWEEFRSQTIDGTIHLYMYLTTRTSTAAHVPNELIDRCLRKDQWLDQPFNSKWPFDISSRFLPREVFKANNCTTKKIYPTTIMLTLFCPFSTMVFSQYIPSIFCSQPVPGVCLNGSCMN